MAESMLVWKLGARRTAPAEADRSGWAARGRVAARRWPNLVQGFAAFALGMDSLARLAGPPACRVAQLSAPRFPRCNGRMRWNLAHANLLDEPRKAAILALLGRLPDEDYPVPGDFPPGKHPACQHRSGHHRLGRHMHASPAGDVANTCLWSIMQFMGGSGGARLAAAPDWPAPGAGLPGGIPAHRPAVRAPPGMDGYPRRITDE